MKKEEYNDILTKACFGNKDALQKLRNMSTDEFNEHTDIKHEYNMMSTRFEACSNILERLRKSFWQYILFRFKI